MGEPAVRDLLMQPELVAPMDETTLAVVGPETDKAVPVSPIAPPEVVVPMEQETAPAVEGPTSEEVAPVKIKELMVPMEGLVALATEGLVAEGQERYPASNGRHQ